METGIVSYLPEKCFTPYSPLINAFERRFTCSVMLNTDTISNEKTFRLSKCFLSMIMCTSARTQRHSLISFSQELKAFGSKAKGLYTFRWVGSRW